MSSQSAWQCLSVQDFFSQNNWQGHAPQNQQSDHCLELSSWQCLSVQDFFSQSNWQGQRSLTPRHSKRSLSLTSSVVEFFECIDWEGNPQIAALPKTITSAPHSAKELKLTDLSNLF